MLCTSQEMPNLQLMFSFHFSSLALLTCTVYDMGVIQEKLHILTYSKSGLFVSEIIHYNCLTLWYRESLPPPF